MKKTGMYTINGNKYYYELNRVNFNLRIKRNDSEVYNSNWNIKPEDTQLMEIYCEILERYR